MVKLFGNVAASFAQQALVFFIFIILALQVSKLG